MDEIWRDMRLISSLIDRMSKYREDEIEHLHEMILLVGTMKINIDEIYSKLILIRENRNG